jgi:hypothetical protein
MELTPGSLLRSGVMVVANDPGNFPRGVFVLPEMNELSLATINLKMKRDFSLRRPTRSQERT